MSDDIRPEEMWAIVSINGRLMNIVEFTRTAAIKNWCWQADSVPVTHQELSPEQKECWRKWQSKGLRVTKVLVSPVSLRRPGR